MTSLSTQILSGRETGPRCLLVLVSVCAVCTNFGLCCLVLLILGVLSVPIHFWAVLFGTSHICCIVCYSGLRCFELLTLNCAVCLHLVYWSQVADRTMAPHS